MKAKTLIGLTAMLAAVAVLLAGHWSPGRAQPVATITLTAPGGQRASYSPVLQQFLASFQLLPGDDHNAP